MYTNIEIKARCNDPSFIREYLINNNARFVGCDDQTDIYFNVPKGRLKLRTGPIENSLIYYERPDIQGPKSSRFHLVPLTESDALRKLMEDAYGILVIVKKKREIYYIDNVKFHIDEVIGLGSFIEIEAGNVIKNVSEENLEEQCKFYMKEFGLTSSELVNTSYSDMLISERLVARS